MTGTAEKSEFYSDNEERINVATHLLGLALSFAAAAAMVAKALAARGAEGALVVGVFGATLILAYASSTLYHNSKSPELRKRLRVLDHAAIYALIAGTYTPFTLITLRGSDGWTIFTVCWALAVAGAAMKLFFTGRFNALSTALYVAMGWIIILDIKKLLENLPLPGFLWLLAGGICYTAGAALYATAKIKFNHAIFHVLTLAGSACHVVSVTFYVIPR